MLPEGRIYAGRAAPSPSLLSPLPMQNPALRPNRSELIVPGIRPELFAKAVRSEADVIVLDLEDSVAEGDKEQARRNVVDALRTEDFGGKVLSVRVNSLDHPGFARDVEEVVAAGAVRLDLLMVPKIDTVDDVRRIVAEVGLGVAQLHGQESPDFASALGCPVWKAMDVAACEGDRHWPGEVPVLLDVAVCPPPDTDTSASLVVLLFQKRTPPLRS